MRRRERGEREQIVAGVLEHLRDDRVGLLEHADDLAELSLDEAGLAARDEHSADDRGDHGAGDLGDLRQDVAHEMNPATLPRRALERDLDRGDQPGVRVGDHQPNPAEAARLQRPEERRPERLGLRVADVEAEDLAGAVSGDADRDDDRLGDDLPPDSGLAVGRVDEHIRVGLLPERALPECGDVLVEVLADAGHLRLGDPGVRAEGLDEVIDLTGGHAVNVGLHHDREQGLIDPATPLQQRREERPRPQLRDPQIQIPGRGGQRPRTRPVADCDTALGALIRSSADERGRFRVDQFLVELLRREPDPVADIGGLQFPEKLEEGRLV